MHRRTNTDVTKFDLNILTSYNDLAHTYIKSHIRIHIHTYIYTYIYTYTPPHKWKVLRSPTVGQCNKEHGTVTSGDMVGGGVIRG